MDIVKEQEGWGRIGTDEPWEPWDRSRVVVDEFRDTDGALESANKAGQGTPLRSGCLTVSQKVNVVNNVL